MWPYYEEEESDEVTKLLRKSKKELANEIVNLRDQIWAIEHSVNRRESQIRELMDRAQMRGDWLTRNDLEELVERRW